VVVPAKNDMPVVMTDVNIAPPKVPLPPVPPVPPPPPPPAEVKTAMITVPKIVDDKDVPDNLRPIENKKIGDAQPGLTTSNGVVGTTGGDTKSTGGTGVIATELPPNQPKVWVQQMPQFDGQMEAYISSHIRYPEVARNQNISGRVVVQFVVNEDGSVTDAKVVHGIGGGCDEEALRMVAGMPRWKPGKQNGIPVKVYFTIPIKFVLN
jgi:protein TonB